MSIADMKVDKEICFGCFHYKERRVITQRDCKKDCRNGNLYFPNPKDSLKQKLNLMENSSRNKKKGKIVQDCI